jgi:hypothetical protein
VCAIERDFRLYAVALLVETVCSLDPETQRMFEQVPLAEPEVLAVFTVAKRVFLDLDTGHCGMVVFDDFLAAIGAPEPPPGVGATQ